MSNFASFQDDWKLLKKELQDPAQARCLVKPDALELITSMTQTSQSARPDVTSIRESTFFLEDVLPVVEPDEGHQRPVVGDRVRIVKGLDIGDMGILLQDDGSLSPFQVERSDGTARWYAKDKVRKVHQQPEGILAPETSLPEACPCKQDDKRHMDIGAISTIDSLEDISGSYAPWDSSEDEGSFCREESREAGHVQGSLHGRSGGRPSELCSVREGIENDDGAETSF
jgi:hypothetical protein